MAFKSREFADRSGWNMAVRLPIVRAEAVDTPEEADRVQECCQDRA